MIQQSTACFLPSQANICIIKYLLKLSFAAASRNQRRIHNVRLATQGISNDKRSLHGHKESGVQPNRSRLPNHGVRAGTGT